MKQELLGQTIEISESRVQYNKYRKRFTSEAKQAAKRFRADYQNNNRGIVNVIENTPEQIQRAIEPTIDYCIQTLVDHGILTIDQSRFEEMYEDDLSLWQKPYLRICDKSRWSRTSWMHIALPDAKTAADGLAADLVLAARSKARQPLER